MSLLNGEKLQFLHLTEMSSSTYSDNDINKKYVAGEVRIVTEAARYPLITIPKLLASGDYELNPEFQRRHRWHPQRQSKLIESLIMNVPIPPIFLYEDRYSHYQVMDGLQRLTAIREFYENKLELAGLEEWPELNGRTYKTLPEQVRRGVDRRYLSSIILLQETAKNEVEANRLKQLVFERINSGGVRLEPQESRNAIYDGPLNRLCIELSRTPELCRLWMIPEPSKEEIESKGEIISGERLSNPDFQQMKDVELVLRFFAYRQRDLHNTNTLRTYLDNYLNYGNKFSADVLKELASLFQSTISLCEELFGTTAFCVRRQRAGGEWHWRQHPSTVVYDPLTLVVSEIVGQRQRMLERRQELDLRRVRLFEQESDLFGGRQVNPAAQEARVEHLRALFS
jgi:hypothetical protein